MTASYGKVAQAAFDIHSAATTAARRMLRDAPANATYEQLAVMHHNANLLMATAISALDTCLLAMRNEEMLSPQPAPQPEPQKERPSQGLIINPAGQGVDASERVDY